MENDGFPRRYKMIRTLGQGGFGRVFLARDLAAGRDVALKMASGPFCHLLRNEYIRLHRFRHPGLPEVYDFSLSPQGESGYLSLEYCPGESLSQMLAPGAMPPADALPILEKLCRILSYLHQRGLVHGDIKPDNVMVSGLSVKLLDLGQAGTAGAAPGCGTPAYAPPESLSGQGAIIRASDVYSLGLLLFQMLTGELPRPEVRLNRNEPLAVQIKERFSGPVADLLVKMLRYDPIERYDSAWSLLEAGCQAGIFSPDQELVRFAYASSPAALREALGHDDPAKPRLVKLAGGQGSGRTGLLKEIDFISRLRGRDSYYLDLKSLPKNDIPDFDFAEGALLLIDHIKPFDPRLEKLSGTGRWSIICAGGGPDDPSVPSTAREISIGPATEDLYRRILKGCFEDISLYDLGLLACRICEETGDDVGRAEELIQFYLRSGWISKKEKIRQVKWPEILANQDLPENGARRLSDWWQDLSADQKTLAGAAALGQLPAGQPLPDRLRYRIVKRGDRYAISDQQCLRLVMAGWGQEQRRELIGQIERQPDPTSDFFCREAYRTWLPDGEQRIRLTTRLYNKTRQRGDIHRTLLLARELLATETTDGAFYRELAEQITDLCCRMSRWSEALESWQKLENSRVRDWKYWKRLFYIISNGKFYEEAENKIKLLAGRIGELDPELALLGQSYQGYLRGIRDGSDDSDRILRECLSRGKELGSPRAMMAAAELLGIYHYQKSRWDLAIEPLETAMQLWNQDTAGYEKSRILAFYGNTLGILGSPEKARDRLEEAISHADSAIPDQALGKIHYSLGSVYFNLRDWDRAEEAYRQSMYHLMGVGSQQYLTEALTGLANIAMNKGGYAAAHRFLLALLAGAGKGDRERGLTASLSNLSIVESLLGQKELAAIHIAKALEISRRPDSVCGPAAVLKVRAGLELEQGKWPRAIATYQEAMENYHQLGIAPDPEILADLSFAEHRNGNTSLAREYLSRAKENPQNNSILTGQIKIVEGILQMVDDNTGKQGLKTAIEAGRELMEKGDRFNAANCWLRAAEEAVERGRPVLLEKVLPWLVRAESLFIEMGTPDHLGRAREMMLRANRICFDRPDRETFSPNLLNGIYRLAGLLATEVGQRDLAGESLKLALEMTGAERGALFLLDQDLQITMVAQIDLDDQTRKDALEFSATAVRAAAGQGRLIISNDASLDEAFRSRLSVQRNIIRSLLCVPLHFREGAAGAVYLDSRITSGLFGDRQREFLLALAGIIGAVLESGQLISRLRFDQAAAGSQENDISDLIIGQSPPVRQMIQRIKTVAQADITVMLDGESGSGKELAALAVHRLSFRGKRKFLALDCGSLPETLLESELFGYVRGAFTGAGKDKPGLFESADGGTVFLDEIASASQAVQSRLLRVLESGEIRRVGESESRTVDVRVICATNKDLETEINEGRFREDLYYRLKVMTIPIPPLRERSGDILLLAEYFKEKYCRKFGKIGLRFDSEAKQQMIGHAWPGNVRELENTVQRAVLLTNKKAITPRELEISPGLSEGQNKYQNDRRPDILEAVKNFNGNISQAAKALGVSRRHLYRLMEKHNIKV